MKPLAWAAVTTAPLLLASVATAGDYHKNGNLRCNQCHIMHFSQSHGFGTGGLPPAQTGGSTGHFGAGPQEYLLRDTVNNLCLSCHDESFASDVLGDDGSSEVRSAGALNRVGVGTAQGTGHTLDFVGTAPHGAGGTPWTTGDEGLTCIDCHHQHGYAGAGNAYRNLKVNPGNAPFGSALVTYNDTQIGTFDPTKDVFERAALNHDESQVDWCEPDPNGSAIATWCAGCHDEFHGAVGGAEIGGDPLTNQHFIRHPASTVNIGGQPSGGHSSLSQFLGLTNRVKVMSASGDWDGSGGGTDLTPTCITCHKGHGNNNPFGLIYRSGGGTLTEEGDTGGTRLEHLCGQCHVQAGFFNPTP